MKHRVDATGEARANLGSERNPQRRTECFNSAQGSRPEESEHRKTPGEPGFTEPRAVASVLRGKFELELRLPIDVELCSANARGSVTARDWL
jgi:hypothetical protein